MSDNLPLDAIDAKTFPDEPIVSALRRQLSWSHY
jgi:hypothetical protein